MKMKTTEIRNEVLRPYDNKVTFFNGGPNTKTQKKFQYYFHIKLLSTIHKVIIMILLLFHANLD